MKNDTKIGTTGNTSAVLRDAATNETQTLRLDGSSAWGWELSSVGDGTAVVEHAFTAWSQIAFVSTTAGTTMTIRKPVGKLEQIRQPRYAFSADYNCRQDTDPTDWLGRVASNLSNGDEPTINSAVRLMAPNPDSGLFGNPEDLNKFVLTGSATLLSTPFVANKHAANRTSISALLWQLSDNLPASCSNGKHGPVFENVLTGMVGGRRPMRAVNQGMWSSGNESSEPGAAGCGAEIMAVALAPMRTLPLRSGQPSIALLKVTTVLGHGVKTAKNTTYIKAVVDGRTSAKISVVDLGAAGSAEFYSALAANARRWGDFEARGARVQLPSTDTRYQDTAQSLLSMYLNTDRGLLPEYGGGKFWNTYNEFLPLDTLALCGALLEWGHKEALPYLGFFFETRICSQELCVTKAGKDGSQTKNVTKGEIIYSVFGCDSDADYGRLISSFVQAVRVTGNTTWASMYLPTVQAMAGLVLAKRDLAVGAFPKADMRHGIVPGSPEHDICGAPGYFFSINVWYVRGLLDLHRLHVELGAALTGNATLEKLLLPTAEVWRQDIRVAADYTAVRRDDGNGLFFLHPVVGSVYGDDAERMAPLKDGGMQATCVERGTCFASMTAEQPGGGTLQTTNYANFRIFSETLLAGVLEERHALAIMMFRQSHRGTMLGMTRFRDGLDDMPILGYGRGSLDHDRLIPFHNTLAGHSLNYLTRGTYWGTEQRQQAQSPAMVSDGKYRNDCGVGGEDCSLCSERHAAATSLFLFLIWNLVLTCPLLSAVVSSVAPAFWIRWMFVSEDLDQDFVYLARVAPTRWYQQRESFGITEAPTRFGQVNFTIQPQLGDRDALEASVSLRPRAGVPRPTIAVRLSSGVAGRPFPCVSVTGAGAKLVAWHPTNETVWVRSTGEDFQLSAPCKKASKQPPIKSDDEGPFDSKMPEHSWATLPVAYHGASYDGFSAASIALLAKFPVITLEKCQDWKNTSYFDPPCSGFGCSSCCEENVYEAVGAQVKALNSKSKVIAYLLRVAYMSYEAFNLPQSLGLFMT